MNKFQHNYEMDRPHLIIDGYNFILRRHDVDSSDEHALWDARERLVHQMIAYLGQKKMLITIVFDGQDIKGILQKHRPAGISVRFSKAPMKADPLILEIIRKSNNRKSITLVTSDRALAGQAADLGCHTLDVENFLRKMTRKETNSEYSKKYKPDLTSKEMEEWLKLFGDEQKD